jgi:hypothetical protein
MRSDEPVDDEACWNLGVKIGRLLGHLVISISNGFDCPRADRLNDESDLVLAVLDASDRILKLIRIPHFLFFVADPEHVFEQHVVNDADLKLPVEVGVELRHHSAQRVEVSWLKDKDRVLFES